MSDEAKKYFNGLLQKINGLHHILIHDFHGVILMKLARDSKALDLGTRQPFLSTFAIATEHASKLGMGKNQSIITAFANYQIIQMNKMPLVVTFIGSENCNTGHVLAIENEINQYLEDFKIVVNSDPL